MVVQTLEVDETAQGQHRKWDEKAADMALCKRKARPHELVAKVLEKDERLKKVLIGWRVQYCPLQKN